MRRLADTQRSEGQEREPRGGSTAVVVAIVVGIAAAILLGLIPAAMVARHASSQQTLMAERIATLEQEQAAAAARAMQPPPAPVTLTQTQVVAVIPTADGMMVTQIMVGASSRTIEGGPANALDAMEPVSLIVTQLIQSARAAQDRQDQAMAAISQNVTVVRGEVTSLSNGVYREVSVQREETRQQFVQTRGEIGRVDGRVDTLKTNAVVLEGWLGGTFRNVFGAGKPSRADDLEKRLREATEALVSMRAREEALRDPADMVEGVRRYFLMRKIRKQEAVAAQLQADWDEHVAPWVRLQQAGETSASSLQTLHGGQ